MNEFLFWIYLINAIFLTIHEIESAYWQEWKMFKLKGGITGFLILHFPVLFLFLYGLVLVSQQTFEGYIISLLLSFTGIFAFTIHMYFIKIKKREEFTMPISVFILLGTLVLSLAQGIITIYLLVLQV
ncbi:MAG: hypothetical protein JSV04_03535 [Candidatus Heimdallarchaeota archaeon]|nr:MAG: hypothetical protein JSV04_03535 [Candidatus Heimdallarchaeota archaeon]